jgi:hypothetical protein
MQLGSFRSLASQATVRALVLVALYSLTRHDAPTRSHAPPHGRSSTPQGPPATMILLECSALPLARPCRGRQLALDAGSLTAGVAASPGAAIPPIRWRENHDQWRPVPGSREPRRISPGPPATTQRRAKDLMQDLALETVPRSRPRDAQARGSRRGRAVTSEGSGRRWRGQVLWAGENRDHRRRVAAPISGTGYAANFPLVHQRPHPRQGGPRGVEKIHDMAPTRASAGPRQQRCHDRHAIRWLVDDASS